MLKESLRKQVIREQEGICVWCGQEGCLTIHHIRPRSKGGRNVRENLVGLHRTPCHDLADKMIFEHGVTFPQMIQMREGVEYPLKRGTENVPIFKFVPIPVR